jgi:hypothetical protein
MMEGDDDHVIASCGCVYCDIGIEPETWKGEMIHRTYKADPPWVPCLRADNGHKEAPDVSAEGQL